MAQRETLLNVVKNAGVDLKGGLRSYNGCCSENVKMKTKENVSIRIEFNSRKIS